MTVGGAGCERSLGGLVAELKGETVKQRQQILALEDRLRLPMASPDPDPGAEYPGADPIPTRAPELLVYYEYIVL